VWTIGLPGDLAQGGPLHQADIVEPGALDECELRARLQRASCRSPPPEGMLFHTQSVPGDLRVTLDLAIPTSPPARWTHRHLLGLEDLSRSEMQLVLDRAEQFVAISQGGRKKRTDLKAKVIANLFFEPSTRTRTSFGLAARRLSGDTLDFTPGGSSLSKGETFIDTAKNIEAMGIDLIVVRHASPGAPHLLSRHLGCGVVNAGDGAHEHPTQGLLDIFTIRQRRGRLEGLTVGLVGDIAHSRVARSNIHGLTKLGARVIVCGPPTLVPQSITALGVEVSHRLDDILPRCDVINMLRIQFERQRSGLF